MLNRLSLAKKLAGMVVVPVAALVIFAGMDLQSRAGVRNEMILLENLTRLAMVANQVAGALHDERSVTAGSLTAEDSSLAELELRYNQTDQAVAAMREQYDTFDTGVIGEELSGDIERVLEGLGQLAEHRQSIASGEVSTAAAVSGYNDLTRPLLAVGTAISQRSNNVEIKTMLLSLDLVARLKESADLERAALNVAFTADQIGPGLLQAVVEMISRQETLEQVFLAHAPDEIVTTYEERVAGKAVDEVDSIRFDAMDGVGIEELGVNPRRWWRASTVRIDAIAETERLLSDLTLERVEVLRGQAGRGALLGIISVLLAVGGGVGLSAFVGRGVSQSLTQATQTISESVGQIMSSVQQLTASTGETAAAVTQTSTTVDELRQTSEAAAKKAEATSEAAESSRIASGDAQQSVESGIDAMQTIRTEVEGIAERIVEVSEKNAQISGIIQDVNAVAEQSNLLAVNASIEAAKAGEHGRGFAVVAGEVKILAERSKEATEQIRTILADIQRASNGAVMVTEQGMKRVDEGNNIISELGQGIHSLAATIEESSDASKQISLISSQQLAGIEQITEALRSVEQAASDNAAGAEQLEQSAQQLEVVSSEIADIVQGKHTTDDGS